MAEKALSATPWGLKVVCFGRYSFMLNFRHMDFNNLLFIEVLKAFPPVVLLCNYIFTLIYNL
ncbi:MAG: hypothetical protein C4538_03330 [Nitrospiraceae bacterium]|nr:MAG: hypothetical protein C4538_03330 [Nitrospiraceae bacterium]